MPDPLQNWQEALILPDELLTNPYFEPAANMPQRFELQASRQLGQELEKQYGRLRKDGKDSVC